MDNSIFYFDSYAIIEILAGNLSYQKYADKVCLLTKLNLFEVYYSLLRE